MSKVGHNKKMLIAALEESLGIVTMACKSCGVSRSSYYEYYNADSEFKDEVDDIENIAIDFVESKLFSQIKENNPTSTIFYLKTKAKSRGYIETRNIDHSSSDGSMTPKETKIITAEMDQEEATRIYQDMINGKV